MGCDSSSIFVCPSEVFGKLLAGALYLGGGDCKALTCMQHTGNEGAVEWGFRFVTGLVAREVSGKRVLLYISVDFLRYQ